MTDGNMTITVPNSGELADDLLHGAERIAIFIYGKADDRRKIYHLAETSRIPIFRLGAVLCARKSVIRGWIEEQEKKGIS